jgi:protein O-GlcNAc transferase
MGRLVQTIMDIKKETTSALEFLQSGDLQKAEHIFRDILEGQPNNVSALHFIGVIYYQLKKYDAAIKYIKKALQFGPDYVDAYNNLGSILLEIGRLDEAVDCFKKAIELHPDFDRAYYNLGAALKEQWRIDDAMSCYRRAIQLNPHLVEAYNNLGLALQDQGNVEKAEEYYRCALEMRPDFTLCFSNLLILMNYNSRHDAQSIFAEHLRFSRQIAKPRYPAAFHYANDRRRSRQLRVGYVSASFNRYSVNYFLEPVLVSHNHDRFEVFCYSDVSIPDNTTERMRGYSDQWREIKGMPDEKAAELIRKEGIDILVDLAGHTGYNRMLVFARKPAPVQISWLGYPNTTGLSTIDYRIVDGYTDPPGLTDPFYTEKLIRLPDSFLCYLPDKDSPAVSDLPAMKFGHITFGSFNYFPKVSPQTAELWAKILIAVPGSRLVMKTRNFADSATRRYAMDMFIRQGIAAERIELLSMKTSFEAHLDTYNRIDIALDTFPYNGTTTTCEALWMGAPVVTFAGNVHASRVGRSILTNIGLPELVAGTFEEYISIAVNLAGDLKRLQTMREGLRDRMVHSPLTDAERFIVNLENCYLKMWEEWCNRDG